MYASIRFLFELNGVSSNLQITHSNAFNNAPASPFPYKVHITHNNTLSLYYQQQPLTLLLFPTFSFQITFKMAPKKAAAGKKKG